MDLQKLGEVLVALRLRLDGRRGRVKGMKTFKERGRKGAAAAADALPPLRLLAEWAEMQKALGDWRSEAERQARHLPINHGILLKQAQVLHQMQLGAALRVCLVV